MTYVKNTEDVSADKTIINIDTPKDRQKNFSLTEEEVILLAQWCYTIEKHYGKAMDIEWAKDGINDKLYIVQARPETVHGKNKNRSGKSLRLKKKENS